MIQFSGKLRSRVSERIPEACRQKIRWKNSFENFRSNYAVPNRLNSKCKREDCNLGVVERSVQIECGVDQAQMRKRLRKFLSASPLGPISSANNPGDWRILAFPSNMRRASLRRCVTFPARVSASTSQKVHMFAGLLSRSKDRLPRTVRRSRISGSQARVEKAP